MILKLMFALALAAFGSQAAAPDIDLTVVAPRNRVREPVSGSASGGLVGQSGGVVRGKSSAQVILLSVEPSLDSEPHVIFEVQVQNQGNEAIEFPVDPNLADFESKSASVSYGYQYAYIALFANLKEQGSQFLPGITLYASEGANSTLKRLDPGDSLRIRGRVAFKPIGTERAEAIPSGSPMKVSLLLGKAFVSQKKGVLNQDSEQLAPQITSSNSIPFPFPR
jgi:hypothetical protein